MREARVEADRILNAVDKAKGDDAYMELTALVDNSIAELLLAYHGENHHLILDKLEALNKATMKLAELMMNTAVRGALKGTKIDA